MEKSEHYKTIRKVYRMIPNLLDDNIGNSLKIKVAEEIHDFYAAQFQQEWVEFNDWNFNSDQLIDGKKYLAFDRGCIVIATFKYDGELAYFDGYPYVTYYMLLPSPPKEK